ncbi:MAG: hypothetical protein ABIT36_12820 [Steroidobacteraceae bacterium]
MSEKDSPAGAGDYVALVRRRWLLVAVILPLAVFIAMLFAYGLTASYRSTATLILEASSIQEKLIATTVASYADQQIEIVQGRVMDVPTLEQLILKTDLYPSHPEWSKSDKARQILMNTQIERVDPVTLEPLQKSSAFSLHYENPSPELAAKGASELSQLFLTYHQKVRSEAARDTIQVLEQQAATITTDLQKVDQEVSQLKARVGDALPDARERNQSARDRSERDLESIERDARNAQERESQLEIQLSSLSPRMMTRSGDLTDLATVRAQLAEAQQKYTPDHPDVKRLQRAMETLMAQNGKDGVAGVKADNPEYLRVAGQLAAARREVVALRSNAERARAQYYQYSGLISSAPGLERQYADLERRRSALQIQFQDIQARLGEARLGSLVESGQRGERFTMVWPPCVPGSAVSPNRLGIILLGLVLGLALSAVVLAVAESADPSVRGLKDVNLAGNWGVIGTVPEILVAGDLRLRRRKLGTLAVSYALGIALIVGVMMRADRISRELNGAAQKVSSTQVETQR